MQVSFNRLLALATVALAWLHPGAAQAARWVVIGDSLSAEYDSVPEFPGVENPTAYAAISFPGWESMNWVEILARLRPSEIDLGGYQSSLLGWGDLRFSGYEFNFAIPGFTASQFEDIVTSSILSNQQYLLYRNTLASVLGNQADHVVIWLGANEFRANYGFLYDRGDPTVFLHGLRSDLTTVVDFVLSQNPDLPVTLVTIPDLGASPDKQQAHPDPVRRALVSQIAVQANQAVAEIAAARGLAVADVFAQTQRLIDGETFYFGAVDILPGLDPDNDPRYHFTRDGLHPNTPLQFEIARTITAAYNEAFADSPPVPQLTDAEALDLLGLDPDLPYWEWIEPYAVDPQAMESDPDADGYPNLTEYAFGTDPGRNDHPPVHWLLSAGTVQVRAEPDPRRVRHVQITVRHSPDLLHWDTLPQSALETDTEGRLTVQLDPSGSSQFLQFRAVVLAPGS